MSNTAYVGVPVLTGVTPQYVGPVFGMNVIVENLVVMPLTLALAERAAGARTSRLDLARQVVSRLLRSPLIHAIVLGVIVSLSGLALPEVLQRTVTMFAQASTGPALFVIGGLLVGQRIAGGMRHVAPMTIAKLVVHPVAMAACVLPAAALAPGLGLPPLPDAMRSAAILCAALPSVTFFPILAARHGEEEVTSAAMFVTTLIAAVTLTGVLVLLRSLPGSGF